MYHFSYAEVLDDNPGEMRARERKAVERSIDLLKAAEAAGPMPGFSTQRIQPQIRVLVALAVTFAVAPLIIPSLTGVVRGASNAANVQNIMARNAKGSNRILAVQQQLRKIEEAKMADLQRRLQAVKEEQVALVKAMNDDGALQNLFLDAMRPSRV